MWMTKRKKKSWKKRKRNGSIRREKSSSNSRSGRRRRRKKSRMCMCMCMCLCELLGVKERGERGSILDFLIYPTTVYCQSGFSKHVFLQRNKILSKFKLRSPLRFTV